MHNQKVIELQLCEFNSSVHTLKPLITGGHSTLNYEQVLRNIKVTLFYAEDYTLCFQLPFFDSLIIYLSFLASVSTVLPPQKRYQLSRETGVRCMLK